MTQIHQTGLTLLSRLDNYQMQNLHLISETKIQPLISMLVQHLSHPKLLLGLLLTNNITGLFQLQAQPLMDKLNNRIIMLRALLLIQALHY